MNLYYITCNLCGWKFGSQTEPIPSTTKHYCVNCHVATHIALQTALNKPVEQFDELAKLRQSCSQFDIASESMAAAFRCNRDLVKRINTNDT